MPFDPTELSDGLASDNPGDISLRTLAQLTKDGSWQLALAHDRPHHLLLWITRGQGVALLDGARRGVGPHNALFIPANHLMAVDLGRQSLGMALILPADTGLTLPQSPQHLRIRDADAQTELTTLTEALSREQTTRRPLCQSAILAYGDLVAIWLRRQMAEVAEQTSPTNTSADTGDTAARHLSRSWCAHLIDDYVGPASMARHAAMLGVTPTHLTRVCKAETGRTAARLLGERQLHAAHQLLIRTNVPVKNIARHLGFGSAPYFTRFIKQHTGKTPTALRQTAHNHP